MPMYQGLAYISSEINLYFFICSKKKKTAQICNFSDQIRVLRDTIIDCRGTLRICGPFKKYDTLRTGDAQKREATRERRDELKISPVEAESDAVNGRGRRTNVEYFLRMPYISSLQVRDVTTRLQSLTLT